MHATRRMASLALAAAFATMTAGCGNSNSNATGLAFVGTPTLNQYLSQKIHHVFVIVQENHTFDNYFGTYPGANGFSSASSAALNQYDPYANTTVKPFKSDDPDQLGPDNDREVTIAKEDGGAMDKWVSGEYAAEGGGAAAEQTALTTIAYYDCDTIPYLWMYASNFTLYDNYFQADTGPSTPGNLQVFAAQVGQTQYSAHASEVGSDSMAGVPDLIDDDPAYGPGNSAPLQIPLDFATIAVLLGGSADASIATQGTFDVNADLTAEATTGRAPIQWIWAEEGFNAPTTHDYVAHHVAPQYFDYIRNTTLWNDVEDTQNLFTQISGGQLASSGVYYIKGGRTNPYGLKPASATIPAGKYLGDDDHPGSTNSDAQIAEAFVANAVNTIAQSPYWSDSAIIITWDDNGGYFDHVKPPTFESCPDGNPCGDGPRLPMIVISPYANTNVVEHDVNDATSISKFIETVFNLPTMASLPFESANNAHGGPRDSNTSVGNLTSAFDINKLAGTTAAVSTSKAIVPGWQSIPSTMNCKTLGITPVAGPSSGPPAQFQPQRFRLTQLARNEKDD